MKNTTEDSSAAIHSFLRFTKIFACVVLALLVLKVATVDRYVLLQERGMPAFYDLWTGKTCEILGIGENNGPNSPYETQVICASPRYLDQERNKQLRVAAAEEAKRSKVLADTKAAYAEEAERSLKWRADKEKEAEKFRAKIIWPGDDKNPKAQNAPKTIQTILLPGGTHVQFPIWAGPARTISTPHCDSSVQKKRPSKRTGGLASYDRQGGALPSVELGSLTGSRLHTYHVLPPAFRRSATPMPNTIGITPAIG